MSRFRSLFVIMNSSFSKGQSPDVRQVGMNSARYVLEEASASPTTVSATDSDRCAPAASTSGLRSTDRVLAEIFDVQRTDALHRRSHRATHRRQNARR